MRTKRYRGAERDVMIYKYNEWVHEIRVTEHKIAKLQRSLHAMKRTAKALRCQLNEESTK